MSYPSGKKVINWETHSLTVDNNQIILFPCGYEFYIANYPEAGLYLAEMLYYPIDLIEKFQKFYAITDQIRNTTGFCLPQNPELIYCWEQLKTSISRGFSTQIQEHLAMGVLLSLGAHHVNCLLLSDSKQSLISRCYNLMLSGTWNKMDSKQGSEISLHFCFHIASPSGKRGSKFSKYIGRREVK